MHDLQLVGVHEDGEHLLVRDADGRRFRLRIDEPLRAAVRRDRARLGQLQIEMEGGVRPRDIQARIRAGETAEDVAASAGLPLEHVRRYEGPVLAEREHVTDLARRIPARQVPHRPAFGDLVAQRLTARGVVAAEATWDAWRRQGSTWTVQLAFRAGTRDRVAQWSYDVSRSHLEPTDDESRWLSAEAADPGPVPGRRLAAVRERVYDVEADGGVLPVDGDLDRLHVATDQPDHPFPPADEPPAGDRSGARTLELLDTLRGRRGRRQPLAPPDEDGGEDGDGDTVVVPEVGSPVTAVPAPTAAAEPEDAPVGSAEGSAPDALADRSGDDPVDAVAAATPPRPVAATARQPRSRRASVPSWDEIVFGSRRD